MKVEVFTYEWTYSDVMNDEEVTQRSKFKVTREFVDSRMKNNLMNAKYRIIEDSKEAVDSYLVVEGKYHPELRAPTFQTQVK